jgi:F-type H+-transporting ATPase subunit a
VPNRMQSIAEMSYIFIANLVRDTVGAEGRPYFPFIFSIFMFILFGNIFGMVPYSFTFTSHIIVTFALASFIFVGVTLLGIYKHKLHFLSFFLPPGVPMWMAPLLIPIEIISYLSRPVSLSVRLFANMMAPQSLRQLYYSAWRAGHYAAGLPGRLNRPRSRYRLLAGVYLHHPHLFVCKRCDPSPLIRINFLRF